MDLELTDREVALRDLCRDFATGEIEPHAARWSEEERCPVELFRQMGELGLMGLLVPEEDGGIGMSTAGLVAALQEIGRADQSVAAAWQAHLTIGTLPILNFGTPQQRERWLRPLVSGQALGAFGLTEPEAGSDAAAIRTRAVRDGNQWRINGQKMFISNAGTDMSLGVTLLARIGEQAQGKPTYGNFVVERGTPGFTVGPKLRGIGWRGLDTRPLAFDDVVVHNDHRLGSGDQGLAQFLAVLEVGRISVAALSLSLASAVLDHAVAYANQRVQFGQPIARFQGIQFKLADVATELEAARWLTYRAAALRDAGRPFRKEAAMAKLKASSVAVHAASEAVQVFGGYGYMMETPVARFYCDAKVLEIGEGSNEIQRIVVAREIGC